MAGRLATYVEVDGTWYGPNDRVPDEVADRITNQDAWAEAPTASAPAASAAPEGPGGNGDETKEPPRGGPGSSAEAWRTFMVGQGFDVPEGASAKDMQAAWDDRNEG